MKSFGFKPDILCFFPFTSTFYLLLYITDFFKHFKRQLKPDLILGVSSVLVTTSGEWFCGI